MLSNVESPGQAYVLNEDTTRGSLGSGNDYESGTKAGGSPLRRDGTARAPLFLLRLDVLYLSAWIFSMRDDHFFLIIFDNHLMGFHPVYAIEFHPVYAIEISNNG